MSTLFCCLKSIIYDLKASMSFCDESIITLVSKIFAFGLHYYGKQK